MQKKKKIVGPRKDTVGKLATELAQKEPETRSPIEQMREQLSEYEVNIYEAVDRGLKTFDADFYVVVETKREKLLQNVLRNYFIIRSTCPTPNYDQVVYKYSRSASVLDFIWVIPSQDTCFYLRSNALLVAPEEKDLLNFVLDFDSGDLLKKCRLLNGETQDNGLLII